MNLKELVAKVVLDEEIVTKQLAPFRVGVEELDWKTLEVPADKEMTLDAEDPTFKDRFRRLKPQSLDDVREWVGIPRRVFHQREMPATGLVAAIRPNPTLTARIPTGLFHSISPVAKLGTLGSSERDVLFQAAKNLVYGDVKPADLDTPLYQAATALVMERSIPIFFGTDIIVGRNATLNIASSVAGVFAYRIMIWKGGRIVTPLHSYMSFHCYSVEGGIG